MSARTQVVAAQVLLFLGAIATELTAAIERGELTLDKFEPHRLITLLCIGAIGYMTKRRNDVTQAEAERRANDAWLKGVQLGRDSTPVPAPGGAANDNASERISDAG